ncbi:F-box domain protein [Lophium mytilinum]|uniref:F-box domain protein n=1 Tax=Lophium mytilinum TaxID=390894 RepID=A0A6A6QYH2_9PEZI|nr:F-box domain protein [Lophium mytilinum]
MGFMKHFRSRSKLRDKDKDLHQQHFFPAVYTGPDRISRLPEKVLRLIFQNVCPHSTDETCESSESSIVSDGCMLCDLRDLANCSKTRRQWYPIASGLLYHSIRIDAVHYCELEEIFSEKRRRKSRNEAVDPPTARLQLLCRTVRDNQYCASAVQFLKLPYMTRETSKADLARTVSVLPNLLYVDLPEGFFTGDPSCHTLRQELQVRCPHIRKMKYEAGAEQSLELLLQRHWQDLQILEISKLRVEPTILRQVLASLPVIRNLSMSDMPWLQGSIFQSNQMIPEFPALHTLTLSRVPEITAEGLVQYLARPDTRESLKILKLKECAGIPVSTLHSVLWAASHLVELSIIAQVTNSLPMEPIPPLQSISLRNLHFEITSVSSNQHSLYPPALSYYNYLTNSLMSNSLPALRELYVRDPDFPESLTLAPPIVPFADSPQHAPRGFHQQLEVFSKGLDELEWVYTSVMPSEGPGRRGSMSGGRPLSAYTASKGLGAHWGGEARKSVVVGNGFGGFLAVPADDERPRTAGSMSAGGARGSWVPGHASREHRGSKADLWR